MMQRLSEACLEVARWAETGDLPPLDLAIAALREASALAAARPEPGFSRSVEAALFRLQFEAQSWDIDPAGIIGALAALRDMAARRCAPEPKHGLAEKMEGL